ncbi:MAG: hypothetical protein ACOY3U_09710, partial [Bacillota bacterium]
MHLKQRASGLAGVVDQYMVQRMPVPVFYPWYDVLGEGVPSYNRAKICSGQTGVLLQRNIFCALMLPGKIP